MNWLKKISGTPYRGTLYHGSSSEFEQFDLSFAGQRDWGDYGVGVYLSADSSGLAREYAQEAVKQRGGNPLIYVVKANLSNVANFDELMEGIRSCSVPEDKVNTPGEPQTRPECDSRAITEFMTSRGFDAARVGNEVVVYDSALLEVVKVVSPEDLLL